MTTCEIGDDARSTFSKKFEGRRGLAVLAGEVALTPEEVCTTLRCSRSWLYSPAGRAVVGDGFKIGGSRRYRSSIIAAVLA
jgi:hypothetical protein